MALLKKLLVAGLVLGGTFLSTNKTSELLITRSKMSLEESARLIVDSHIAGLHKLYKFSDEELNKFDAWIDSTLVESARDSSNSIIVNKTEKILYLIKNGKVDSEYAIDLGGNSYEDKQKEGDFCTPEGRYVVKQKLYPESTSFYKAFLIDYPNKEDKIKGKTGGAIEIHGKGGQGYNWTHGCMASSNEDMDKLFQYINKGDMITIVRCTSKDLFP